jgi:hypothetical protein
MGKNTNVQWWEHTSFIIATNLTKTSYRLALR